LGTNINEQECYKILKPALDAVKLGSRDRYGDMDIIIYSAGYKPLYLEIKVPGSKTTITGKQGKEILNYVRNYGGKFQNEYIKEGSYLFLIYIPKKVLKASSKKKGAFHPIHGAWGIGIYQRGILSLALGEIGM
jgi:hypothetical protein